MTPLRPTARPLDLFLFLAGSTGALWGLALARALAESFPASPTFDLGPTLLVTLTVAGGVAGLRWRFPGKKTSPALVPLLLPALYLFWPGVAPRVGWTLLGGSLLLALLFLVDHGSHPAWGGRPKRLTVVLALTTLALYLRTLGPTVGQADTFEFQVTAPTWGVAHPTGYPLYILSGKLFSLLPVGSVAWRVNLSSAIFGTAAVVLLYKLVQRILQRADQPSPSSLPALIAASALAFSPVFWSQAVVAEVYTLHNMFVVAVLLLLVRNLQTRRELFLLAFVLGLSFSNHLTTALLLPGVGLALFFARPRLGWRGWLTATGLFLLGLSFYLYIYFRWPMLHNGTWMSLGDFGRYVTGQQFGGALRLDAWRTDPARYEIVGRLLRESLGWPGLALSALGLAWLALKQWRVALITGVTFAAYAWYALSYYVPDVSVFLLPAHLILAVWLGLGATLLVKTTAKFSKKLALKSIPIPISISISISCLSLLPLWLVWTNLPRVDQSGERAAYLWGKRVLDLPLAPDAAILADSARIAPLYYLQHIEGRRPDLDMLVLADEATYRAQLQTRLADEQTVYLARFLPGLEGLYHLRSLGPLTEVGTTPLETPPPMDRALDVRFVLPAAPGGIQLLGLDGPTPGPDGGAGLTLYWRAEAPIDEVYYVRLRLVDERGQVWWPRTGTGHHAANDYYPTPAWHPGEVVVDYHEIPPLLIGPATSSGRYTVQVGLFRPFSDEGLTTAGGERWVSLIQLAPSTLADEASPAHPLRARFGEGLTLTGVDLPPVVAAGTPVELALHWHPGGDAGATGLALAWIDQRGERVDAEILERWGQVRASLQAPATPGKYDLHLAVTDPAGRERPARCGWLARQSADCNLANVRVTTAALALANFDERMLLLDAEIGAPMLHPGDVLPLVLRWQALQPMKEDYTVSVQLIGPEGRLYGQTDAWPVQGTLPTSQWSPGQRISDPYEVRLRAAAPPGHYRVGVAVYLLATQTRLPLVDRSGQVVGDMAWAGKVTVVQPPLVKGDQAWYNVGAWPP